MGLSGREGGGGAVDEAARAIDEMRMIRVIGREKGELSRGLRFYETRRITVTCRQWWGDQQTKVIHVIDNTGHAN